MIEQFSRLRIVRSLCALVFFTPLGVLATTTTTAQAKHKHHHKHTVHHVAKKASMPAAIPANVSIQQGIDQIINSFNHNLSIGVIVQSTADGATLYQHNANQLFTPGSTMKLFTATSALAYLGPDYVFATQFLAYNMPQNGVLPGNLYVKFSGDPTLTVQDLTTMVKTLYDSGVHAIHGDVIIDDLAFDHENSAPGWNPKDQLSCVNGPTTGAIVLNRNCFGFNIVGGRQSNAPAQVSYGSGFGAISVINQVTTRHASYATCPFGIRGIGSNTYVASGCLAPHRPIGMAVSLTDTRRAGTNILIRLLQQQGITINYGGGIGYGPTPPNLRVLAQHDSPPLGQLITHMLKKSDNLYANTFFKKLGNVYFNTTGSWTSGIQAVREILGPRTGIDFSNMTMLDGCGLSHQDQVSPAQFAALLNYAYRAPTKDVFYDALPKSGIDGTLRNRLGGATQGRICAKTGTVDNASGLAGYIQTNSHQTLTFAILVNGVGSQGTYHMLQDRICKFLAQK